MSELHLTDEILMAFADGELDEPVAAAVARVMALDPAVSRKIVEFQQSRRLTRSVFASNLAPDVPTELRAAVAAQIEVYETANKAGKRPEPAEISRIWPGRLHPIRVALAASLAAVAVASGYFIGRQSEPAAGRLAHLEDPFVLKELSRLEAGREVELPVGRLRVISTYRLPNESLCREFRLQSASATVGAVACRTDGWKVTFALAEPAKGPEYVPSSGSDLVDAYLSNLGAGTPLRDEAEAKALSELGR
ncbi:hypothetical protein [Microvirga terrestris]|uniref:Anti-sigma factor n=1 Tax=Microvirga terrestris TaxID=2791024 RepID=A0ABS0HQP7_9HYPH|nr:hypothetical protein [Microvirga terrestris]MBF9195805.1 hypothetical protein [Microvirga terrestris]